MRRLRQKTAALLRRGESKRDREIRSLQAAVQSAPGNRERAEALYALSKGLLNAGRFEEALPALAGVASIIRQTPPVYGPLMTEALIVSLLNRQMQAFIALDRPARALESAEMAMALLDRNERLRRDLPHVKIAMGRMTLLEELGRLDDAYEAAEQLISTYTPPATDDDHALLVAMAVTQGSIEVQRGNHRMALAQFEAALENGDRAGVYTEMLWRAMLGLAVSHEELGEDEKAIEGYRAFIERYDSSDDKEIQDAVKRARLQRGFLRPR